MIDEFLDKTETTGRMFKTKSLLRKFEDNKYGREYITSPSRKQNPQDEHNKNARKAISTIQESFKDVASSLKRVVFSATKSITSDMTDHKLHMTVMIQDLTSIHQKQVEAIQLLEQQKSTLKRPGSILQSNNKQCRLNKKSEADEDEEDDEEDDDSDSAKDRTYTPKRAAKKHQSKKPASNTTSTTIPTNLSQTTDPAPAAQDSQTPTHNSQEDEDTTPKPLVPVLKDQDSESPSSTVNTSQDGENHTPSQDGNHNPEDNQEDDGTPSQNKSHTEDESKKMSEDDENDQTPDTQENQTDTLRRSHRNQTKTGG